MSIVLDLPPNLEERFAAEARDKGIPLSQLLIDRLTASASESTDPAAASQGVWIFGSPEDAALLDDVVTMAYQERRRPPARR